MPIFGGVRDDVLAFLLERVSSVGAPRGEYFFREGSRGTATFVLEEGRVAVTKRGADGEDQLLDHLDPGDCFGEVALLDFGPRSASVRAVEDSLALRVTCEDLLHVAKRDTEQFALIYMNLARELGRRLRAANERLVRARLAGDPLAADYEFRAD